MSKAYRNQGIFPRWADFVSQILVVYSIVTFTLETEPALNGHIYFQVSEILVTLFFFVEYLARIYCSENKKEYITSFYGVIDLIAILPVIASWGLVDLRFVRIMRLMRLLRLLKFVRYSRSMNLLIEAAKDIKGELTVFMFTILGIVYVASVGIYVFEAEAQPESFGSITRSMWWAFVTLTTVGYGDVIPVTAGGKAFTVVIMFLGLGVVAIPSGLLASALTKARDKEAETGENVSP